MCTGESSANTTSFARQGQLAPKIAVTAVSRLFTSLCDMFASSTLNGTAATIILAATVALRSKHPGIVCVFFGAFLPSLMRCCSNGPVPLRGTIRTPTPNC